jgi:nucleotide-binding universal stress UspA family protein
VTAQGRVDDLIRRVVAGVDGSEPALHAALWAAREAQVRGVPLTLVHAVHLPDAAAAPRGPENVDQSRAADVGILDAVSAQVRDAHPDLVVETEISPLSPTHRLAELSAPEVLVVTGTRGHGGFAGMLLGSVSRALAAHADGPLVVVRGPEPETVAGPVVLGVGLEPAESAVEYAFSAARRYEATLRVVRAWPVMVPGSGMPEYAPMGLGGVRPMGVPDPQTRDKDEKADAARAIEAVRSRFPDVRLEITALAGNPVPVLRTTSSDARLIVVGSRRRRGLFSVGAGYAVEGLLSHSPIPVAVIPMHKQAQGKGEEG